MSAENDEKRPICGRFPSLRVCGCTIPCRQAMREVSLDRIRPGLFIGPVQSAYLDGELKTNGVDSVVNASGSQYTKRDAVRYLDLDWDDDEGADILPALRKSFDFIQKALARGGAVLVHCHAGKSRSATICVAWLMASERLRMAEALTLVQGCHPRAAPNHGFLNQLARLDVDPPDWFRAYCCHWINDQLHYSVLSFHDSITYPPYLIENIHFTQNDNFHKRPLDLHHLQKYMLLSHHSNNEHIWTNWAQSGRFTFVLLEQHLKVKSIRYVQSEIMRASTLSLYRTRRDHSLLKILLTRICSQFVLSDLTII